MQADWVGRDQQIHSPQTPMVNDVLAIQSMYGTSTTTRSGDTVYGFNSTATARWRRSSTSTPTPTRC
jgi:serralysin